METIFRDMKIEEKREVKRVMNRSFPLLMRLFVYFTKNIVVAVKDGVIVGGSILKSFRIDSKRKGGLICFIFTHPEYKGMGIGKGLTDQSLKKLKELGCNSLFAMVEGDNTPSSNLFSKRGFNIISLLKQFKLFGFRTPLVWIRGYHLFDIGHFIWYRGEESVSGVSSSNPVFTTLFNILFAIISYVRLTNSLTWNRVFTLTLSYIIVLGLRTFIMWLVARSRGLDVEFRIWESGFILSFFISLVFGGLFTIPGSIYPRDKNWRYDNTIKSTFLMALLSSIMLVGISLGIKLILLMNLFPQYESYLSIFHLIIFSSVIVDVAIPFFPMSPFNGKRIWDYNKLIWVVLTIPVVIQFFI